MRSADVLLRIRVLRGHLKTTDEEQNEHPEQADCGGLDRVIISYNYIDSVLMKSFQFGYLKAYHCVFHSRTLKTIQHLFSPKDFLRAVLTDS